MTRYQSCGKVSIFVGTHQIGTVNLAGTTSRRQVFLLPTFAALRGTVVV